MAQKSDFIDGFLDQWEKRSSGYRDLNENAGLYRAIRLAALLDQEIDQLSRQFGLRAGQFQALAALRRFDPKPLSPSEIGHSSILTSGTITVLLDRLEQMELITRRPNPNDRRGLRVSLTAEGRRRVDQILKKRTDRIALLMDTLTKAEKKMLSSTLRKLLIKVESEQN